MTHELRCRPGDLAIVTFAEIPANLGLVVRVLFQHDGQGKFALKDKGPLWTVECSKSMVYRLGKQRHYKKRGPVPDSYLKPIRGGPPPAGVPGRALVLEQV